MRFIAQTPARCLVNNRRIDADARQKAPRIFANFSGTGGNVILKDREYGRGRAARYRPLRMRRRCIQEPDKRPKSLFRTRHAAIISGFRPFERLEILHDNIAENQEDGGRDRDRTCDPYDVNAVHAAQQPGFPDTLKRIPASSQASKGEYHGRNLGAPDGIPFSLTGLCHQGSAAVEIAARWLAEHRDELPDAAIPFVRERFGLTALEAIEALKEGHRLRYARA
jgi:hypothetical protein